MRGEAGGTGIPVGDRHGDLFAKLGAVRARAPSAPNVPHMLIKAAGELATAPNKFGAIEARAVAAGRVDECAATRFNRRQGTFSRKYLLATQSRRGGIARRSCRLPLSLISVVDRLACSDPLRSAKAATASEATAATVRARASGEIATLNQRVPANISLCRDVQARKHGSAGYILGLMRRLRSTLAGVLRRSHRLADQLFLG